ncbi:protein FAM187B [Amia ocellicauda]|uniref:protein FAM187B n=1 Tax=Amia ocellicauda TaxID=2972642 RepID=UPI003464E737
MTGVLLALVLLALVLLALAPARGQADAALSCPGSRPCLTALMSSNAVYLDCPNTSRPGAVSWHFTNLTAGGGELKAFVVGGELVKTPLNPDLSRLVSKAKLVKTDLKLTEPQVYDSGGFRCQEGRSVLAHYKIDFQDAQRLRLSLAACGQTPLGNETVDAGSAGQLEVYTRWGAWQACDRGEQRTGERKRVGFCYVRVPKGEALPCGLARLTLGRETAALRRGPELQVQGCRAQCSEQPETSSPREGPVLLKSTIITRPHQPVRLQCPGASIYSPVYWERNGTGLTWLGLLRENGSHSLDVRTGGGVYRITGASRADAGLYRCFVSRTLTGRFTLRVRGLSLGEPPGLLRGSLLIQNSLIALTCGLLLIAMAWLFSHACHHRHYRRLRSTEEPNRGQGRGELPPEKASDSEIEPRLQTPPHSDQMDAEQPSMSQEQSVN